MNRNKFWLIGVVGLTLASTVSAQTARPACDDPAYGNRDTIAELQEVQGNVLVSDASGMAAGVDKQRLKNQVRVTTTSRATVLIAFDCGCDVRLKENERLDVDAPRSCPALLAAVAPVVTGAPIGAVVATAGISTPTAALIATGVGVGAYLLYRNNRNVSPN